MLKIGNLIQVKTPQLKLLLYNFYEYNTIFDNF